MVGQHREEAQESESTKIEIIEDDTNEAELLIKNKFKTDDFRSTFDKW